MVRVQKGAVLYEHGRKRATFVAAATLLCVSLSTNAALAEGSKQSPIVASVPAQGSPALQPVASSAVDAASATPVAPDARPLRSIYLFIDGAGRAYDTNASTVGEFLAERGIVPTSRDAVSDPLVKQIRSGMDIAFRRAVPVTIVDGTKSRTLQSSAQLVREVLLTNGYVLGSRDEVSPSAASRVASDETIRVTRIATWTTSVRQTVPVAVRTRYDRDLATGVVRTESAGRPGVREVSTRFERRGDVARQVSFVSRIVREPQDRVIVHGIGRLDSFAHMARTGFDATMNMAGQAISMIATAYTAACYGCSGVTASGQRAGHGIVAVDPSVIPLGTRLFIPGYGAAVAGDTGGAIVGHRIDLGFDSNSAALEFGRRPITVYVLKK